MNMLRWRLQRFESHEKDDLPREMRYKQLANYEATINSRSTHVVASEALWPLKRVWPGQIELHTTLNFWSGAGARIA